MFETRPEWFPGSNTVISRSTPADATGASQAETFSDESHIGDAELADRSTSPRRTPRLSLVVVLPENHVLSPDRLKERIWTGVDGQVDVLVACAGQPINLSVLQRTVGGAQFLLAPAGTSTEELRELAIREAPGDIVRLVDGALLNDSQGRGQSLSMSS